jgi:DNA-binding MarR family transcriptional regulator
MPGVVEQMQEKHGGAAAGPMDLRVWVRMLSCVMQIEKQLRRNFADHFGTTLPRFDVMASLDRFPEGQSMSDLSRALLVSNGNVTAIVRELEAQGLVIYRVDPADRRSAIVALTAQGKHRFDQLAAAHHQWVRQFLAHFPLDKQRELFELLADLKSSIARA